MTNALNRFWRTRFQMLEPLLHANGFDVFVADHCGQVGSIVLDRILPEIGGRSISWGGSMTFIASGLYEALKGSPQFDIIDTFDKNVPWEETMERRRRALLTDVFITGSNAITEKGHLVNLDMIGNRVAALTFGPRHVIVLAGRNKIVTDNESAMSRIKKYAAPANAMRLDKKTPCAKTSTCEDCKSPDRICNTWTITEKSFPKGRIKIVLINEDLGL